MQSLLEIEAVGLKSDSDSFENKFQKHLVHSKKDIIFAPALRDSKYFESKQNDLLKTYIHVYN